MYRLEYSIDGIKATRRDANPKNLRDLITNMEKSCKLIDWYLYNCGGVLLDSKKEQDAERRKK